MPVRVLPKQKGTAGNTKRPSQSPILTARKDSVIGKDGKFDSEDLIRYNFIVIRVPFPPACSHNLRLRLTRMIWLS